MGNCCLYARRQEPESSLSPTTPTESINSLESILLEDIIEIVVPDPKSLSFYIPQLTKAQVIKVYDGDTITVASTIPGMIQIGRAHV